MHRFSRLRRPVHRPFLFFVVFPHPRRAVFLVSHGFGFSWPARLPPSSPSPPQLLRAQAAWTSAARRATTPTCKRRQPFPFPPPSPDPSQRRQSVLLTPPPSPPCPDHACPLSMARPQKKPQSRHSSGAFLSAPVLPLSFFFGIFHSQQPIHCQLPGMREREEFIEQVATELARAPDRRAEEMILMDRVR